MGWSNRVTLAGFTVTYSTFQMAWEVEKKREGMKSPPDGSIQNKRQRIFALDGSEEDSKFPFVSTI
jgi:hypothetical protein